MREYSIGDVIEISQELAYKWFNLNSKMFLNHASYYAILKDIRKSSRIYYIFDFLKLKESMTDIIYNKRIKYYFATSYELKTNRNFIHILDSIDIARLYLYSEIKTRSNK